MNNLLLSHAWLAGLALLAPLYLLSRRHLARAVTARPTTHGPTPTSAPALISSRVRAAAAAAPHAEAERTPMRVLRVVEHGAPAARRLRISGRMADVCAELDRLAAREAMQAS